MSDSKTSGRASLSTGDSKTSSRTSLPPRAFLKPAAGLPCKGYSFLSLFLIHIKKGGVVSTPPVKYLYFNILHICRYLCGYFLKCILYLWIKNTFVKVCHHSFM